MSQKQNHKNRFISSLLAFCFVLASMIYVLPVYAVDSLFENDTVGIVTPNDEFAVGTKLTLEPEDVPEIMSFSEAQSKGHVYRLREKETDLNTLVFLSDDNTQTMYVYPQAVKYVDANGNIKDKSTALTASGTDLVMADNDVKVRFPQSISQGITVSKEDRSISMMPSTVSTSTRTVPQSSKAGKTNRAIYTDAFGEGVHLEYTATFAGVKEDIILDSYTGKTEFSFIINTNGLYPVKNSNGSVSFYDPSTDAVVAEMMQVYCIDAVNNFAGGDIRITEMKQNQKYVFTVIPDIEFLTSETTVYPVTVDPTITMDESDTVEDAVIYSGKPTHNYGDHKYATIGYLDSTYQKGEYLVKFPKLAEETFFYSTQITSAYFHIYTASGKSATTTVNAYGFKNEWNEATVTWNTVYPNISATACISTTTVPSGGTQKMSVNILNIFHGGGTIRQ